MALGSLPIGALAAGVSYILVKQTVELRQRRRRERIGALSRTGLAGKLRLPPGSSTQGV
jgi:uncharacterized protein (DUF2062 family)